MSYVWDIANKNTYNNRYGWYKFNRQFNFISKHFTVRSNVLDIAGGSGRFALPLFEMCQNITVIDINEEALALLASRNHNINRICGDFINLPLGNTYTFMLCIEAISYFKYEEFFNKIDNLLDDNGTFVFMMVNPDSWRFKLRNFNLNRTDYKEIKIREMREIIESKGLRIDSLEGFNWIPLPLKWSNSPLVNVFAFIEKTLGLNKLYSQSPWLMVSVKKGI